MGEQGECKKEQQSEDTKPDDQFGPGCCESVTTDCFLISAGHSIRPFKARAGTLFAH
jgi:hypothetical protein